jgi:hydroxymethylglutaryl-CoA reductase
MIDSRISGLYRLGITERIAELEKMGCLSSEMACDLEAGRQVIAAATADRMIENVVGVFGLPMAIVPNFIVNNRECIVPLVVEEPSIVAGLSRAAAQARSTGGFSVSLEESLLAGQIHITGVADIDAAIASLNDSAEDLMQIADAVHPRLRSRGGGVREIEFRELELADDSSLIVIHVLVDTGDAMGANLVNTICESIAPRIADICGGEVVLRILSNLTDRSICVATVRYAVADLAGSGIDGADVRDRIVLASEIAIADPYRAVTHNKGVMNGVDALAIATGNDWRSIEAAAHAFAARGGTYSALTHWSVGTDGDLIGEIKLPLKLGIVGGTARLNPGAVLGLAITGVESAAQLAELMAAVGLAQNFAALRALVTTGIQSGHMRLHARSIAASEGAPDDQFDDVVQKLVDSGEVKAWKAREIIAGLRDVEADGNASVATAAGKIILLGEHAVVYGRHALAVPILDAVRAAVSPCDKETMLAVKDWGLRAVIDRDCVEGVDAAINLILDQLEVGRSNFKIVVSSRLPRGMGLGSSAAMAVAITRAVAECIGVEIDNESVNKIAFACEKLAHGTPSGIDNTLSCYGEPMLFRNAGGLDIVPLQLQEKPPVVIGFCRQPGPTDEQVAGVKSRFEQDRRNYDNIFDQIDEISQSGAAALEAKRYDELGRLMNVCHGLLNAIQVSSPELEDMVAIARNNGAVGAKLTGAGGGGSVVALCPGTGDAVRSALHRAGYATLQAADFGE